MTDEQLEAEFSKLWEAIEALKARFGDRVVRKDEGYTITIAKGEEWR